MNPFSNRQKPGWSRIPKPQPRPPRPQKRQRFGTEIAPASRPQSGPQPGPPGPKPFRNPDKRGQDLPPVDGKE